MVTIIDLLPVTIIEGSGRLHTDLATYRFGPSLSAPLACLCLRRLRRFTWVGRTTRPWSPTAAVLAVAISARAPIAILAGEDTLSRGLRTSPLPATHASVGDCWQNSRCRHLLLEEQHISRDTLVSHANGQKPTLGCECWIRCALSLPRKAQATTGRINRDSSLISTRLSRDSTWCLSGLGLRLAVLDGF